MRIYSHLISFILFLSVFFVSVVSKAYAACGVDETDIDITCIPNSAGGFVGKFYGIGLGLIGGIALLFLIIGGYCILTSQGDPVKLSTGRSYITYAIIGLLLAIFGYVFISIIVVDILRVPGFN